MTVTIGIPGSKSMTQRALVIAALGDGPVTVRRALDCEDSRHLLALLSALGAGVERAGDDVRVDPKPLRAPSAPVFCGNGGTVMRFGSCMALAAEGELTLDGDARMRERPFRPLGDALARLGVRVRYLGTDGFPPVALCRTAPPPAGVDVDGSQSSQFASGLLLAAPALPEGLAVRPAGARVSLPYLTMTTAMMARAGARVRWEADGSIVVEPGRYRTGALAEGLRVEGDWSAAAFFLAASAITGVAVEIPGLEPPGESLQGDAAFATMLEELARPRDHHFDLGGTPDLLPPLAAAALFADRPSAIRGAAHARVKECDRIAVLIREFARAGARVVEHNDGMDILPLTVPSGAAVTLDPEGDHRMAMAFGLLSLRIPSVAVRDPECVGKSFPDFWCELAKVRDAAGAGSGS